MTFNKKAGNLVKKAQKHHENHEKEGKCINFDQKSRNSCFFLKILMLGVVTMLPTVNNSDYTITVQSLCSHCVL